MTEIERHPQAVRQGAAAAAVAIVTVAGMPVVASRAAEQRDAANWADRATAFSAYLDEYQVASAPNAGLVVEPSDDGYRARATAALEPRAFEGRNLLVKASLRGSSPLAASRLGVPAVRSAEFVAREQHCLAEAIYYEARGESRRGQLAVAEVVSNRVRSSAFPKTYCGVVYQGSQRATGCQFSFTCDGSMRVRPHGAAWRQAQAVAGQVISGLAPQMTYRATHYHTTAINPYWSSSLVETTRIGAHVFYRFPNSSERATLVSSRSTREEAETLVDADQAATPVMRTLPADTGDVVIAPKTTTPAPGPEVRTAPVAPKDATPATGEVTAGLNSSPAV